MPSRISIRFLNKNIKNGNLITLSSISDSTHGFSPFLMPPFVELIVDDDEKNRIEELQRNGKITGVEVALMISMNIGLPKEQSLYIHFLNNMEWMVVILWKENCFVAATVKDMKEHAKKYALRYR